MHDEKGAAQEHQNYFSIVNPNAQLNKSKWVITVLSTVASIINPHAVMVVEGITPDNLYFIGQYDIAANGAGDGAGQQFITKIRMFEGHYTPGTLVPVIRIRPPDVDPFEMNGEKGARARYNQLGWAKKKSYYVKPSEARYMIMSIREDAARVKAGMEGRGDPVPYKRAGRYSAFGNDQGDNCQTFISEKMLVAGVDDKKWLDSSYAHPTSHTSSGTSSCIIS